jgi:hypothetical protein
MKFLCLALLILAVFNVESFREGRFRHIPRFGWNSGFGAWNHRSFIQPVIVERPILTPFGIVEQPIVVQNIVRPAFGRIGRIFKRSIDESKFFRSFLNNFKLIKLSNFIIKDQMIRLIAHIIP